MLKACRGSPIKLKGGGHMKREVKISADSAATILLVNSALGLILDDGLTTESIEELETLYDHLGDVITDMSERNEWNEKIGA
jgi:hypothetical protein